MGDASLEEQTKAAKVQLPIYTFKFHARPA